MRRRVLLLTGGVVLAVALTAPAGAGQKEKVKTKITVRDACLMKGGGGPAFQCRALPRARRQYVARFQGRLKSDIAACEKRRKVKLILKEPFKPRRREIVATVKSDEDGRWRYEEVKPGFGRYVAKATKKRKGDLVCKGDKATTDHIPEPD
jgi:hypothetical protein